MSESNSETKSHAKEVAKLANYFRYLDELRDSGVTNMFGARPWLMNAHRNLNNVKAGKVLSAWMTTYDGASTPKQRAAQAIEQNLLGA